MAPCAGQGTGKVRRAWRRPADNGDQTGWPGILTIMVITIVTTADFSRSAFLLPVTMGTTTIIIMTIPTTTPTKIVTSAMSASMATGCADATASTRATRVGVRHDVARHAKFIGLG